MKPVHKTFDPEQHTPQDNAFTIHIVTNDKFFTEEGGAPEDATCDCKGYALFTFTEEGNALAAQGAVNLAGIMRHLLRVFPIERVQNALREAAAREMLQKAFEREGN